jgi:hypothetical protein
MTDRVAQSQQELYADPQIRACRFGCCTYLLMHVKPMLTFPPLKDKALVAGATPQTSTDSDDPQAALLDAVQVVDDKPGSLLDELGRARGTVEIILGLAAHVADVSLLHPLRMLRDIEHYFCSCRFTRLPKSHI